MDYEECKKLVFGKVVEYMSNNLSWKVVYLDCME